MPSMSIAPRCGEVLDAPLRLRGAGADSGSAGKCRPKPSSVSQAGQFCGGAIAFSLPVRASITAPSTAGMTSPAFSTVT